MLRRHRPGVCEGGGRSIADTALMISDTALMISRQESAAGAINNSKEEWTERNNRLQPPRPWTCRARCCTTSWRKETPLCCHVAKDFPPAGPHSGILDVAAGRRRSQEGLGSRRQLTLPLRVGRYTAISAVSSGKRQHSLGARQLPLLDLHSATISTAVVNDAEN